MTKNAEKNRLKTQNSGGHNEIKFEEEENIDTIRYNLPQCRKIRKRSKNEKRKKKI